MTDPITIPAPRSVLFVPVDRPNLSAKIHRSGADAVCFDLEDAIPMDAKASARDSLSDAVAVARQSKIQVYVRVNAELELFSDDLKAALKTGTDGIVLPKARGLEHISLVAETMARLDERQSPATLVAMVEDVAGLQNLRQASAKVPGLLSGLLFGPEDYCADLGVRPTSRVLDAAFLTMVEVARLLGVRAFGFPGSIAEFHDLNALTAWVNRGRDFGASGAFCIHPKQVNVLNQAFSPNDNEITWAIRITAAFTKAQARGEGVIALDGQMIDRPVVERAKRILERASLTEKPS